MLSPRSWRKGLRSCRRETLRLRCLNCEARLRSRQSRRRRITTTDLRWDVQAPFPSRSMNPASAEAHNNLGVAFHKAGNLKGAEREFELALKIQPDFVEGLKNFGQTQRDQGNLPAAIQYYRKVAALDRQSGAAHADLGFVLK